MGCEGVIAEHGSSSGGSARCSSCGAATDEYSLFAIFDGHNGELGAACLTVCNTRTRGGC